MLSRVLSKKGLPFHLVGVDTSDLPKVSTQLKEKGNLLIPLFVLLYFLMIQRTTVYRAAVYAIIACIIACAFKKDTRLSFSQIIGAIELGVQRTSGTIAAVACAGVAVGAILLSGVGAKFTYLVVMLGDGNLLLTLLLSAFATIILGMGLPTVAAYLIAASLLASGIIQLGVPEFVTHMFLFYYSILSAITPPVALASYAAANIADANPNKVGFESVRLGIVAFIIPFFFAYGHELLLIGETVDIVFAIISAVIGVFCLSIVFAGWFMGDKLSLISKIILLAASGLTILPGLRSDIIGFVLIAVFLFIHEGTRVKISRFRQEKSNS